MIIQYTNNVDQAICVQPVYANRLNKRMSYVHGEVIHTGVEALGDMETHQKLCFHDTGPNVSYTDHASPKRKFRNNYTIRIKTID